MFLNGAQCYRPFRAGGAAGHAFRRAAESRAASDPLPAQRQRPTRAPGSTIATTPTNLAERAGAIWD
jgi:hypothetical protein